MDWQGLKSLASGFMRRKDIDWRPLQALALDSIAQDLVVQENEGVFPITLTTSTLPGWNAGTLPSNFAKTRAALNAQGNEMIATDLKSLLARPRSNRFFAISGDKIYAFDTQLIFIYSIRVAPMVAEDDRNDLSDKFLNVILYGMLKHAAERYQDFEALQAHEAAYDRAVGIANENYAWATMTAGTESRSPYAPVAGNSPK